MTSSQTSTTVVLVHGAWADGSSWQRVVPLLLEAGVTVRAVQNPTTSLADDVAATQRVLKTIEGPVVLVGHSWGGAVIAEAGNDPKVKALVFVAALPPGTGQSVGDLVGSHPTPPGLSKITDDGNGFLWLSEEGWNDYVGQDLPKNETTLLYTLQPPLPVTTFGDKISKAATETRPNWYIVSTEDCIVSVELQYELAKGIKAKTTELAASHLSLLSKPREVADVILDAVKTVSA
ncbi:alpha/beta hydrolase [Rhizobium oryzicola]|uniref:Alpha/beta hydrolase n=1 Tax=Rhizobium oryzicola TaxID=1232668 RepID=A0ABT8SZG6_9HYPH|nr:alpha/beta hydrolase [Rhizobium oryzicola]MDO1583771.1 alpha/beta hydrolase [Rhizobium oryzicola]